MPINFPNWANLPNQSSGMGDIFENLMRGAQLSNIPRELRNKNQGAEEMIRQLLLGNEAKEQKNQYLPEELQHESFLRGLEKQYKPDEYQQQAIASALENAKRKKGLEWIEPLNRSLLEQRQAAAEHHKRAQSEESIRDQRTRQIMNAQSFLNLPASAKEHEIGIANSLGIPTPEFTERRLGGESLYEITDSHGIPREEVNSATSKPLATGRNISAFNQAQATLAGMSAIESLTSKWMEPYSRTLNGKSPQFIADYFKEGKEEDMGKYLAARAVQPELIAGRIKALQGNVSHAAISEMIDLSLANSDIPRWMITPEVFKHFSHYMTKAIEKGAEAEREYMFKGGKRTSNFNLNSKPINEMSLEEIEEEISQGDQ